MNQNEQGGILGKTLFLCQKLFSVYSIQKNIIMKKAYLLFIFISMLLLSACSSALFDKTVAAYQESTAALKKAKGNKDCDKIHDELMEKLYQITQDYPHWERTIKDAGYSSEDSRKVSKAYKAWDDALKKATTDNHYMFMTPCSFQNAVKQKERKAATGDSAGSENE